MTNAQLETRTVQAHLVELPLENEARSTEGDPPAANESQGTARGEGGPTSPSTAPLGPEMWKAPFYIRYRFLSIVGVLASAGWIVVSLHYIQNQMGWPNLFNLLPHELGGMAAGILTPLALIWLVVALLERGTQLRRESAALQWHLKQLTYPSARAEGRVSEVTESLRRQARELTKVTEDASSRAEAVTDAVRRRVAELAKVSEDADLRAQSVAELLRRQTEDL